MTTLDRIHVNDVLTALAALTGHTVPDDVLNDLTHHVADVLENPDSVATCGVCGSSRDHSHPTHYGHELDGGTPQQINRQRFLLIARLALQKATDARVEGDLGWWAFNLAVAAEAREVLVTGRGMGYEHDRGEEGALDFLRNGVYNRINALRYAHDRKATEYVKTGEYEGGPGAAGRRRLRAAHGDTLAQLAYLRPPDWPCRPRARSSAGRGGEPSERKRLDSLPLSRQAVGVSSPAGNRPAALRARSPA